MVVLDNRISCDITAVEQSLRSDYLIHQNHNDDGVRRLLDDILFLVSDSDYDIFVDVDLGR